HELGEMSSRLDHRRNQERNSRHCRYQAPIAWSRGETKDDARPFPEQSLKSVQQRRPQPEFSHHAAAGHVRHLKWSPYRRGDPRQRTWIGGRVAIDSSTKPKKPSRVAGERVVPPDFRPRRPVLHCREAKIDGSNVEENVLRRI